MKNVREYIRNQEKHHQKFTFDEEYQKFLDDQSKESVIPSGSHQEDIDYYQL